MCLGADLLDLPVAGAIAGMALDFSGGAAVAAALQNNVARSPGAAAAAAVARGAVAAVALLVLLDEPRAGRGVLAALAHDHLDGCLGLERINVERVGSCKDDRRTVAGLMVGKQEK